MIGATSFAKVTADEAARAGAWPPSVTLAPMAAATTNPPHAPTRVRPFIAFLRIKNSAPIWRTVTRRNGTRTGNFRNCKGDRRGNTGLSRRTVNRSLRCHLVIHGHAVTTHRLRHAHVPHPAHRAGWRPQSKE